MSPEQSEPERIGEIIEQNDIVGPIEERPKPDPEAVLEDLESSPESEAQRHAEILIREAEENRRFLDEQNK